MVDPLDGTSNFSQGPRLLRHDRLPGRTIATTVGGWILDVPNDRHGGGAEGAGRTLDGARVRPRRAGRPGLVGYKVRKEFDRQLAAGHAQRLGG
jgi:hypothetical protein